MFMHISQFILQFNTPNTRVSVDSTPLEISIKASTVWGSSQVVTVYSPIPSAPTNIRIFGNLSADYLTRNVTLQHSSIENITNYEIICYYQMINSWKLYINQTIISTNTQSTWPGLAVNVDFLFKVIFYCCYKYI